MPETTEIAFVLPDGGELPSGDRILARQRYGDRVAIVIVATDAADDVVSDASGGQIAARRRIDVPEETWDALDDSERRALSAYWLRRSEEYLREMAERPGQGLPWDHPDYTPPDPPGAMFREAGFPTWNKRFRGSMAIAIVMVSGPGDLAFSGIEKLIVSSQTQSGLSWLATQFQPYLVTQIIEEHVISITVPANPNLGWDALEALWRDPALSALGYQSGQAGVSAFAQALKDRYHTDSAYVAFFTHYPLGHFGYARAEWPETVIQYWNDGWGPLNLGATFAHESGHIFGAPDEYGKCECNENFGFYNIRNLNCVACYDGVPCIMNSNDWIMCRWTPRHIGAPGWEPGTAPKGIFSGPLVTPSAAGGNIYFAGTDSKLCRVNKNGTTDWMDHAYLYSSPVIVDPFIYFRGSNGTLCRIRTDGTGFEWFTDNYTAAAPCVVGNFIYYQGTNDKLYRYDIAARKGVWLGDNYTSSSPVVVGDFIYFQGTNNKLYRTKADGTDGKWLGGSYLSSSPFVANGIITFQGTNDKLYRIKTDGTDARLVNYNVYAHSTPFVLGNVIYFQGDSILGIHNTLCTINIDGTGYTRLPFNIYTSPVIVDEVLYAAGNGQGYSVGALAINLT